MTFAKGKAKASLTQLKPNAACKLKEKRVLLSFYKAPLNSSIHIQTSCYKHVKIL